MPTLRVTSGSATGKSMELDRDLVIGREGADLTIGDDPELSRRHASVRPVDGGVVVEDLGSTNGTFVNGRRITEPTTLNTSGTIKVGTCEIAVDLPPVDTTSARRQVVPHGDDATRARATVPDPAAAAPQPDATAERPIPVQPVSPPPAPATPAPAAEPPTAPQPAAAPAATAAQGAPPVPSAEQPAAGPPPIATPPTPSASPAAPVAEPPAAAPPGAPAPAAGDGAPGPGGPPGGGMPRWLPGALAALAAIALTVFIIVSTTSQETVTERIDQRLETVNLKLDNANGTYLGTQVGPPFGRGVVQLDQVLSGPLARGRTVRIDGNMVAFFDEGSIRAVYQVNAEGQEDGTLQVSGEGQIVDGTGAYENAEGDITFTGSRPDLNISLGSFRVQGEVEYEEE